MSPHTLTTRTERILDEAEYLTLATVSPEGHPWSAVVQYVWLAAPLRFLFGSATTSAHSRHTAEHPDVAGSLYTTRPRPLIESVDGAQFTGTCAELTPAELHTHHRTFYDTLFPDPADRAQWTLPEPALLQPAPHRLYQITVTGWWLVDTTTWAEDRIDRRVEMPLSQAPARVSQNSPSKA